MELPKGVWKWLAENGRDLGRIAAALEAIAAEATEIRRTLQEQDDQEEQSK